MKVTIDAKLEEKVSEELSNIIIGLRERIWFKLPEDSLLRAQLGLLIDRLVKFRDS